MEQELEAVLCGALLLPSSLVSRGADCICSSFSGMFVQGAAFSGRGRVSLQAEGRTSYHQARESLPLVNSSSRWITRLDSYTFHPNEISVQLLSRVWLFGTPWTVACQASLSNLATSINSCLYVYWGLLNSFRSLQTCWRGETLITLELQLQPSVCIEYVYLMLGLHPLQRHCMT